MGEDERSEGEEGIRTGWQSNARRHIHELSQKDEDSQRAGLRQNEAGHSGSPRTQLNSASAATLEAVQRGDSSAAKTQQHSRDERSPGVGMRAGEDADVLCCSDEERRNEGRGEQTKMEGKGWDERPIAHFQISIASSPSSQSTSSHLRLIAPYSVTPSLLSPSHHHLVPISSLIIHCPACLVYQLVPLRFLPRLLPPLLLVLSLSFSRPVLQHALLRLCFLSCPDDAVRALSERARKFVTVPGWGAR